MRQATLAPLASNELTFRLLPRRNLVSGTSFTLTGLTGTLTPGTLEPLTPPVPRPEDSSGSSALWRTMRMVQSSSRPGGANTLILTLQPNVPLNNVTLRFLNLTGAKRLCMPRNGSNPNANNLSSSIPLVTSATIDETLTCQPSTAGANAPPVACVRIARPVLPNLLLSGGVVYLFVGLKVPQASKLNIWRGIRGGIKEVYACACRGCCQVQLR